MKIILGAGSTSYEGWQATQETDLDLTNEQDWAHCFQPDSVAAFLAEHVWEHLTLEDGLTAAQLCYRYLQPGGYLRMAVPDANFQNADYQKLVQVGGPGPADHPAASHKIVYDYQTLSQVFEQAGFKVNLLEYCDEAGCFHYQYWNPADGMIGRSLRYDTRNSLTELGMVSVILDAHKPFCLNPNLGA